MTKIVDEFEPKPESLPETLRSHWARPSRKSPRTGDRDGHPGLGASLARSISLTNTGDAIAQNGGIANTGYIESLTVLQQPATISWPVSIGRIPPLASAFQPRATVRELITTSLGAEGTILVQAGNTSSGGILAGGGGVGKTQLGSWYASQAIRQGTELVIWVDASVPGGIPAVFADAGQRLRVPGTIGHENTVEKDASAFLDWLQTTPRTWFVVLDDIAEPQQAATWWPVSHMGTGSTLATTRRRDEILFAAGRRRVEIDVYRPAEALDYLSQRVANAGKGYLVDAMAPTLAKELGYLPLALSHVAAFLISQRTTTSEYLAMYRAAESRLDKLMSGDPDNPASTPITVNLLLALDADSSRNERVGSLRPAAAIASMLSPAGHPTAVWAATPVLRFLSDAHPAGAGLTRALKVLDQYSLVTIDDQPTLPTVRMHALTARAIREQLTQDEARTAARAVASALLEIWPDREHEQPELAAVLRANSAVVAEIDAATGHSLWKAGGEGLPLARRAIQSWITAGQYPDAISHAASAISAATSVYGTEHVTTAIAHIDIIGAYQSAGALADATRVGEKVLEKLLATLGPDDANSLEAQNSLGVAHRQAGNSDRAIELLEQASEGRRRLLGPDSSDALESRNNVAVAYWNAGRITEAITLHEQILVDRSRILGAEHPGTIESQNNLAVAYWQEGRYFEAVTLGKKTVDDRIRLLGADHPRTLESQHNLTSFYHAAGLNAEAVALGELTLQGHIRVMGADNHRTLNSRHVLAVVYLGAGLTDKAILEEERAVADCLRVLGTNHRYTLAAEANLSACYIQAGQTMKAVELAEGVVDKQVRSFGANHPNTLRSQVILAVGYRQAGRFADAVALGERTVEVCQMSLRRDHPQTLSAIAELAKARQRLGSHAIGRSST